MKSKGVIRTLLLGGIRMNIRINYDFFDALYDSSTPFSPLKVLRNMITSNAYCQAFIVIATASDLIGRKTIGKSLLENSLCLFATSFAISVPCALMKVDPLKSSADRDIDELVGSLKSLEVNTDKNLIRQSKKDGRNYKFRLNDKKIPQFVETKFILMPSYNINGEIEDTDIKQEHVIGTKTYILSKGSKAKKVKHLSPVYLH